MDLIVKRKGEFQASSILIEMPKIIQKVIDQMVTHAKREAPYECCGMLAGRDAVCGAGALITAIYEIQNLPSDDSSIHDLNIPADRTVRYMMDPKEQFQAMRNIRERGLTMMGIYHSHPHSEAVPSETDVRLAFYPEVCYLIISLAKTPPDLRAFFIVDKKITEETIKSV